MWVTPAGYDGCMTTSPSEPVDNDQSGTGDQAAGTADQGPGIDDSSLPAELRPSEDNPLAENLDEGTGADDSVGGGGPLEQPLDDDQTDQPTNDPTGGTPL